MVFQMEHISLHLNTSTLNTNLSSPAIMTSGADGLFGALNPIICPLQHTHTHTHTHTHCCREGRCELEPEPCGIWWWWRWSGRSQPECLEHWEDRDKTPGSHRSQTKADTVKSKCNGWVHYWKMTTAVSYPCTCAWLQLRCVVFCAPCVQYVYGQIVASSVLTKCVLKLHTIF